MSVDGNIGHRGALIPLPHAGPETGTEETPRLPVPLSHQHSTMAVPWTWEGETGSGPSLAQEYATAALQY